MHNTLYQKRDIFQSTLISFISHAYTPHVIMSRVLGRTCETSLFKHWIYNREEIHGVALIPRGVEDWTGMIVEDVTPCSCELCEDRSSPGCSVLTFLLHTVDPLMHKEIIYSVPVRWRTCGAFLTRICGIKQPRRSCTPTLLHTFVLSCKSLLYISNLPFQTNINRFL